VRFREAHGRKVVSAENAESIGRVDAFVVDTGTRSISGLRLGKVKGDATFVSWADITFGPDAVILASSDGLRTARDPTEARAGSKELQPIGKLVLDDSGTALGKIEDVELDPASGAILELDLGDGGAVAGDRLIGIGAYAVVVTEAADAR
jgi:sporulation protein YlmC with PRC-barrel domain